MITKDDNYIAHLLPLYMEGKLDEEEVKLIEQWIASSDSHRSIAHDIAVAIRLTDKLTLLQNTDKQDAWKNINAKIRINTLRMLLHRIEQVAAILLLPLITLSIYLYYKDLQPAKVAWLTYSTQPGMTASITLPDSTHAFLNSSTIISFPSSFSEHTRQVRMQGEAYFAVTHDAKRPFVVTTPQEAKIKVLGTHFNVEAYAKDRITSVTLEEGSVAVSWPENNRGKWNEQQIMPGEQIIYSAETHSASVKMIDTRIITAWKDGKGGIADAVKAV
jgi:ferric-dicitrate binding protein FerR (iron transport regulator)